MLTHNGRWWVWVRDGFRCVYCGYKGSLLNTQYLAVDHMVPESRGGSDAIGNLQTICTSCAHAKGDKTDTEYRAYLGFRKRVFGV